MFNFLIPSCIKNEIHERQLIRCINSIRNFHNENVIYIINDSDDEMDIKYDNIKNKYNNIIIIKSTYRCRGELLCFKFILENNEDDNYFIMHDSMLLIEPLVNIETIKDVKFLWHFTNHRIHWDSIVEEKNVYNIKNNIVSHTDLLKHVIERDYYMNVNFQKFAINYLNNKIKWCGCMGLCCITNKNTIQYMNSIIPFIEIFLSESTRRNRVVNESIFSIICHYIYNYIDFSNSYDGLYYDGITINKNANIPIGSDNLYYVCKNKYIGKISFLR
jgi:hypothetical protein